MKLTKIIVQILFLFQYNYCHKLSMVFGRAPVGRAIAASPPSLRYVRAFRYYPSRNSRYRLPFVFHHSASSCIPPVFKMPYIGTNSCL